MTHVSPDRFEVGGADLSVDGNQWQIGVKRGGGNHAIRHAGDYVSWDLRHRLCHFQIEFRRAHRSLVFTIRRIPD